MLIQPKSKGVGGHERPHRGQTDTWLTPRNILKPLGQFDLDPCAAPEPRPWDTAATHIVEPQDGLGVAWNGRVWLNPPYGPRLIHWLGRLARHGNGIAFVFARTETVAFHQWVWPCARGMLFLKGRVSFCDRQGFISKNSSGAPSVLIAYGVDNRDCLETCGLPGKFIALNVPKC